MHFCTLVGICSTIYFLLFIIYVGTFFSCLLFSSAHICLSIAGVCIFLTSYSPTLFRHSVWRQFCLYIFLFISQSRQAAIHLCIYLSIYRHIKLFSLSLRLRTYMYMLQVCICLLINLPISLYFILAAGESVSRWVIHPLSWYFSSLWLLL